MSASQKTVVFQVNNFETVGVIAAPVAFGTIRCAFSCVCVAYQCGDDGRGDQYRASADRDDAAAADALRRAAAVRSFL